MAAKKRPAAKKKPATKKAAAAKVQEALDLDPDAMPIEETPIDHPDARPAIRRKNAFRIDFTFVQDSTVLHERDQARADRQAKERASSTFQPGSLGHRRLRSEIADLTLKIDALDKKIEGLEETYQLVGVMPDRVYALRRMFPITEAQQKAADEYAASMGVTEQGKDEVDYDIDEFAPALISMTLRSHKMTPEEVKQEIWGPRRVVVLDEMTAEDLEAIAFREDPDPDDPDAPGYLSWNMGERMALFTAAMRVCDEIALPR